MVYDNLFQENTHFTQEEVCESVAGYEGGAGCVAALIESAQTAQDIFESVLNLDFMDAAASHGYNGITESTVINYMLEEEGTDPGKSTEAKDTGKGKEGGIISRVIGALNKFWKMVTSAIESVMTKLKVYFAKDLTKFVAANKPKLPSNDVLSKIKFKFTSYDFEDAEAASFDSGKPYEYFQLGAEKLKELNKKVTAKEYVGELAKDAYKIDGCKSLKEFADKYAKSLTDEAKEVTVDTIIDDVTDILSGGKGALSVLAGQKKACDTYFKDAKNKITKAARFVKSKGELKFSDGEGVETSAKFDSADDKSNYALASSTALAEIRANHDLMITAIKVNQTLLGKAISQAKAVYLKALGGKADADTKAAPESKTDTTEEKAANEAALLEACEFETEMALEAYAFESEM